MNLWQNYILPKTLEEARACMASGPKPLAPIAGGTDLLLDLEQGRHSPVQTLVDITEVKELLALEIRDGRLFVGAGVPVNRLVLDPFTGRRPYVAVHNAVIPDLWRAGRVGRRDASDGGLLSLDSRDLKWIRLSWSDGSNVGKLSSHLGRTCGTLLCRAQYR
jgi:hypothetical protein